MVIGQSRRAKRQNGNTFKGAEYDESLFINGCLSCRVGSTNIRLDMMQDRILSPMSKSSLCVYVRGKLVKSAGTIKSTNNWRTFVWRGRQRIGWTDGHMLARVFPDEVMLMLLAGYGGLPNAGYMRH